MPSAKSTPCKSPDCKKFKLSDLHDSQFVELVDDSQPEEMAVEAPLEPRNLSEAMESEVA